VLRESIAQGGVISGEHGIGVEKRDYMTLLFSTDDLAAMAGSSSASIRRSCSTPARSSHLAAAAASLQRCGTMVSAPPT
jgi:glycolate oxidase